MEPLLIFPCNGNGVEALDCAGDRYEVVGFIDDTPAKQGTHVHGIPVFGRDILQRLPEACVLAVPGSPTSYLQRKAVIQSLGLEAQRFATVVHPKASVSPLAVIGHNVVLMAGVVVTSNAVLGNHLCVLPNAVIHHDVRIDDYCLIGAGTTIAGYTHIGRNCYLGSGSRVINNVRIGDAALVGMGTNVISDVAARSKVVGNPARILGNVA